MQKRRCDYEGGCQDRMELSTFDVRNIETVEKLDISIVRLLTPPIDAETSGEFESNVEINEI